MYGHGRSETTQIAHPLKVFDLFLTFSVYCFEATIKRGSSYRAPHVAIARKSLNKSIQHRSSNTRDSQSTFMIDNQKQLIYATKPILNITQHNMRLKRYGTDHFVTLSS